MGRDIEAIKITGEDRRRYRDKVRRSLDVFARMLREHRFEDDPAQVGVEIELNLVDAAGKPSMRNADVLDAIADPAWATELGQFNLEINVPPRQLAGDALARLEEEIRASLNSADAKARGTGSRLVMVGILPTLREEHMHEDTHVGQRAVPGAERADLRGPRRGHADRDRRRRNGCSPTPAASPRRPPARASSCTSRSPRKRSRATGTRPRPSPASRSRWPRTRRSCSAGGSGTRPGSRCSSRPPTPGPMSSSTRACARGCGSASAGSPRCSTCSRRTSGTSRRCCRCVTRKIRWSRSTAAAARSCPR